jgi:hypothetical protein
MLGVTLQFENHRHWGKGEVRLRARVLEVWRQTFRRHLQLLKMAHCASWPVVLVHGQDSKRYSPRSTRNIFDFLRLIAELPAARVVVGVRNEQTDSGTFGRYEEVPVDRISREMRFV